MHIPLFFLQVVGAVALVIVVRELIASYISQRKQVQSLSSALQEKIVEAARLERENIGLRERLADKNDEIYTLAIHDISRRTDTAHVMRRHALHSHLEAEYQANPKLVSDVIADWVKEERKKKGK